MPSDADKFGDGVSRRSLLAGAAGLVSVSGCVGLPDTSSAAAQNGTDGNVTEPPESLSLTEVEIARQYGKVGVSGVVNNTDGMSGKTACARVALYDGDEVVFEDYIHVGERGGDFGPFVKWWNADAEDADRVDAPFAEFVAERCYSFE